MRPRILLLCSQRLLGESLASLLHGLPEVEVNGPWQIEGEYVPEDALTRADAIVVAADGEGDAALADLVARVLSGFPGLPVIRVSLAGDQIWLFRSRTYPSGKEALTDLIKSELRLEPEGSPHTGNLESGR